MTYRPPLPVMEPAFTAPEPISAPEPTYPPATSDITPERADELRRSLGLFTENELCAVLRVSEHALQSWRVSGTGPRYAKLGRAVYYRQMDVAQWINTNLRTSTFTGGASAA